MIEQFSSCNSKRSLVANCSRPAVCLSFRFRPTGLAQFAVSLPTAHWHMLSQIPALFAGLPPWATDIGHGQGLNLVLHFGHISATRFLPLTSRRPTTRIGAICCSFHPLWQFRGPSDKLEHDALRILPPLPKYTKKNVSYVYLWSLQWILYGIIIQYT